MTSPVVRPSVERCRPARSSLSSHQFSRQSADSLITPEERERLADLAARGDADAFSRLTIVYRPTLLRYARRRLSDYHRAEDVVQDTLLKAWQTRARYHAAAGSSWIKWCRRIADRILIDQWRHERLLDVALAADLAEYAEAKGVEEHLPICQIADSRPTPDEQALTVERWMAIWRLIGRLPGYQRAALTMRADGCRLDEIATTLALPPSTVKVYLYRARSALRSAYAATGL